MPRGIARFQELLLSVYLYNEYRGCLQLESELIPLLKKDSRFPRDFVSSVEKHASDERRHYRMFQGWFRERGKMPFAVGRLTGYFDVLAAWLVGKRRTGSAEAIVASDERFAALCRSIVLTERRGIAQLDAMLRWGAVRRDPRLVRIFETIRRDEPSHFLPYEGWLAERGLPGPGWSERAVDRLVHYGIALFVIPLLYFNPFLRRLDRFAEA